MAGKKNQKKDASASFFNFMNKHSAGAGNSPWTNFFHPDKAWKIILKFILLGLLDSIFIAFFLSLFANGEYVLSGIIFFVALGITAAFLSEKLYPFRWFSPGLALLIVMLIFPTLYNIYMSFTNYSDGHLLSRIQVVQLIERINHSPVDSSEFKWTAYHSSDGKYVLWMVDEVGRSFIGREGVPLIESGKGGSDIGLVDDDGIPLELYGYKRLNRIESVKQLTELSNIEFGLTSDSVKVVSLES